MAEDEKTDTGALLREAMKHSGGAREDWLRALEARAPSDAHILRQLLSRGSTAATQVIAAPPSAAAGAAVGEGGRIGPYRLLHRLGQGGMGEVWLAERADASYSKQVAIKLIATFLGNREAVDWFRRERQALARLEHPHIARLLDGGETADGRPFLVMEYVDGVPIDLYADGLPVDRVIALFLQVCAAIEHAHRALIVHRDIKPANVLVAGEGEAKLLDFGIAKDMDRVDPNADGDSRTQTQAFTLHYASPEQMDGRPITVASDVYSLGALLYRLLSGHVPYAQSVSALGLLRAIETGEPDKPSRAILAPSRSSWSEIERRRISRQLQGDLDDIALKCLRREPERRYGSARELADDLRRHLAHEPVLARRGSVGYRASRWLRRNWLAFGAATAVLVALGGGLWATHWQAQVAERERALAQKRFDLSRTMVKDVLFDFQDRLASVPGTIEARRQLVDRTKTYLQQLGADAQDDPGLLADLSLVERRLGDISGNPLKPNIGDTVAARQHFQRAEELIRRANALRPNDPKLSIELARTLSSRGTFAFWDNDLVLAEKSYRGAAAAFAVELKRAPSTEITREHASAVIGIGDVQFWNGQLKQSLASYDSVCPTLVAAAKTDAVMAEAAADCYTRRADALAWMERYPEAQAQIALAIAYYGQQARAKPDDLGIAHGYIVALMKQGEIFLWAKDGGQAMATYATAMAVAKRSVAADANDLRAARDLALMYSKRGDAFLELKRYPEAIADFRQGMESNRRLFDNDPAQTEHQRDFAASNKRLGLAYLANGEGAKAGQYLGVAVDIARQRLKASPGGPAARRDLAVALEDLVLVPGALPQRCAWLFELRGIWQGLKDDGVLTPTDDRSLQQARDKAGLCEKSGLRAPAGPPAGPT
jgi:eukaryotic-like serine/threonine-protein kinase